MTDQIEIQGIKIGRNYKPFVVAEMSGNHNQSLNQAFAIIEAAARVGVSALKIQTYTPDAMTIDSDQQEFKVSEASGLWSGKSLYQLYREAATPLEWHYEIFDYARKRGVVVFSTPFDRSAVDLLESLNAPCYKIASFENIDLDLIAYAASTGKPLIISTGLATLGELDEAVKIARENGCKKLILLKCTSNYPATPQDSNTITIPHLRRTFGCEVGISDHTIGIGVSVSSVALGATFIEKHFTISRAQGGVDSAFSMEPAEMAQLVEESQRAWESLGEISYGPTDAEKKSLQFRRSLYVVADMRAGDTFTTANLRAIRPGYGLSPKYMEIFIGRVAKCDIKKGTPLSWQLL